MISQHEFPETIYRPENMVDRDNQDGFQPGKWGKKTAGY